MFEILDTKGPDYSNSDDRLANFKRLGSLLGIPPIQVWAVYAMKHMDAIMTYAKSGKVESEEITGRFLDLANYAVLGAALVQESQYRAKGSPTLPPVATVEVPSRPIPKPTEFENVPPWLVSPKP
jgi:hypothetical protein